MTGGAGPAGLTGGAGPVALAGLAGLRVDLQADLQLEIDGDRVTVTGHGSDLQVRADDPAALAGHLLDVVAALEVVAAAARVAGSGAPGRRPSGRRPSSGDPTLSGRSGPARAARAAMGAAAARGRRSSPVRRVTGLLRTRHALGQAADLWAASGLSVTVTGPTGRLAVAGREVHSGLGRVVTGSAHVAPGPWSVVGPVVRAAVRPRGRRRPG